MPKHRGDVIDVIRDSQGRRQLAPAGLGTRGLHPALRLDAPRAQPVELSLAQLSNVTDLAPEEMVLTAEAGAPLIEIDEQLRTHGLFLPPILPDLATLPVAPPASGALLEGTLGGLYSDPRELGTLASLGRTRDHVLGIEAVRGDGTAFKAGGRVVKNVTGYDLTRFLCGGRGRWGVVTALHWRLQRVPDSLASAAFEFPTDESLWRGVTAIRDSGLEPLEAWLHPEERTFCIAECGRANGADVRLQRHRQLLLASDAVETGAVAVDGSAFSEGAVRVRAPYSAWPQVIAVAPLQWSHVAPFAGFGLGVLRPPADASTPAVALATARRTLAPLGATICFEAPGHGEPAPEMPPALATIARRLQHEWDPQGVLAYEHGGRP